MSQLPFNTRQARGVTPSRPYDDKKRVVRPGTAKNPVILRVRSRERFDELSALCAENDWICEITVDEEQPEDTSQLDILLQRPASVVSSNKPGRNDPCICGSGKKYKKCCALQSVV